MTGSNHSTHLLVLTLLFAVHMTLVCGSPSRLSRLFYRKGDSLKSDDFRKVVHASRKKPSTTPSNRAGLSFESCQNDAECLGGRECVDGDLNACTAATTSCVCFNQNQFQCKSSSECSSGEICAKIELGKLRVDVCMQKTVAKQLGFPEVGACIDARALKGFAPEDLIYEENAISEVLCDDNDSCATPGHMVRYKGVGMMMKTYCEKVGCVKKSMEVNSPMYKAGLRVKSNTKDLEYTALAARFETAAEEHTMSLAVRFGL